MDCQRGWRVSPVWTGTVGCLRGPRALVQRCLRIGLPAQWWHTGHEPTCERDKHRGKQQHRIQSNLPHQVQLDVMMTSENVGWGHRMIRLLHPHCICRVTDWWFNLLCIASKAERKQFNLRIHFECSDCIKLYRKILWIKFLLCLQQWTCSLTICWICMYARWKYCIYTQGLNYRDPRECAQNRRHTQTDRKRIAATQLEPGTVQCHGRWELSLFDVM